MNITDRPILEWGLSPKCDLITGGQIGVSSDVVADSTARCARPAGIPAACSPVDQQVIEVVGNGLTITP
jgi:hypothetical protein